MKPVLLLTVALLAACASPPVIRSGNEYGVVVNWANDSNASRALPVADSYCAQYGRRAVFRAQVTTFDLAFDCVR